jgi:hypothetical protein
MSDKNSEPDEVPVPGRIAAARNAALPAAKEASVPSKGKRRGRLPVEQERVRGFIRALLAGKTAPEAAEEAGYPARAIGGLLRRRDVQDAIKGENSARDRVITQTPARIEAQLGNLAFSDVADLFNSDLSLKPFDEVDPEARAAITSITVNEFHDPDGKVTRRVHKIQLERKQPALETLGEIKGLIGRDDAGTGIEFHIEINLEPKPVEPPIEVEHSKEPPDPTEIKN